MAPDAETPSLEELTRRIWGAHFDMLTRRYDSIVSVYGGLRPALLTVAAILSTPELNIREGVQLDVARLLLDAADLLAERDFDTA